MGRVHSRLDFALLIIIIARTLAETHLKISVSPRDAYNGACEVSRQAMKLFEISLYFFSSFHTALYL